MNKMLLHNYDIPWYVQDSFRDDEPDSDEEIACWHKRYHQQQQANHSGGVSLDLNQI